MESTSKFRGLINVKTCRVCSGEFTYKLPEGDVKIICGVPGNIVYKAISYVWGNVTQVPVQCAGCGGASEIPMESQAKFEQLMNVAEGGNTVWLDAISINQKDHQDIATQVAVMGDIYSKAECVSVVLPASDKEAFQLLANLLENSEDIQSSMWLFTQGDRGPEHEAIGRTCQSFFANLSAMSRGQKRWLYWQRTWTFQEWALASGLEILCEGLSSGAPKLTDVKLKILTTALFLARYKLGAHQYSSVDIGFSRGYVPEYLRVVKRLFPREDLFLSNEEIDQEELFTQTIFPHGDINQLLGIRGPHQAPGFRSRLSLMLDAFGTNDRQARFEADLICYWASMCNIKYAYDKHDSRAVALQKVLAALRREGLRIFNFHVNTGARLEVDLHFADYAMAHQLCNSSNKAFLPEAPIYSGQTDTVFHLLHALKQTDELAPLEENNIALRAIVKSPSTVVVELSDEIIVAQQMGRLIQGQLDDGVGFIYSNILVNILQILQGLPRSQLDKFVLVVVDIPITSMLPWKNGSQSGTRRLAAWAICPRNLAWPHSSLKVARESLNGTLVLAGSLGGMPLQAVAYLTIAHAQCGSYLLVADDAGIIEIDFVTSKRSDIMITVNGGFPQDTMRVRVDFEDEDIASLSGTSSFYA
ncbi:heterokaryon incompatibility protein-domain-containing protein [Rhexocercosporidium sp. MPI-PUGE-AT-0058]|nr:heterokaryon incompatibility protein-domain-containing protein [Rhexocercosporidium sp. MPI-PUGE-AT-0058]